MYRLTEKRKRFVWSPEAQRSFDALKNALISPPILGYPNPDPTPITEIDPVLTNNDTLFILDCDDSLTSAGTVLSQVQDGREKVIAYYSHAFSKEQRNYCVTRRELLAIVLAMKPFEPYLQFRKFAVRTDHSSLRWLQSLRNPEQQLFRWLAVLQSFDFQVIHRPGAQHSNADGLSRRPCEINCKHCSRRESQDGEDEDDIDVCHVNKILVDHSELECARTEILNDSPWDDHLIRTAQESDPDIAPILEAKRNGKKTETARDF